MTDTSTASELEQDLAGIVAVIQRVGLEDVLAVCRDSIDENTANGALMQRGLKALEARGVQIPEECLIESIAGPT